MMRRLAVYLKNYKMESILAPLFKALEVVFDLLGPDHRRGRGPRRYRLHYPPGAPADLIGFVGAVQQCYRPIFCRQGQRRLCHQAAAERI